MTIVTGTDADDRLVGTTRSDWLEASAATTG